MASSPPSFTVRANNSHSVQSMETFLPHPSWISTFENACKEKSASPLNRITVAFSSALYSCNCGVHIFKYSKVTLN